MTLLESRIALSFTYPVAFTRGAFDCANPVLAQAIRRDQPGTHRVAVAVDAGVSAAWPLLEAEVRAYGAAHGLEIAGFRIVPGGEQAKRAEHVEAVQSWLLDKGIDRHSLVLAIGGGAMLDMVGFAAATFHRGVRLVRMPTTVLAQNDAAVGVKNGVNQAGIKNLVGSFAVPFAVVADFDFLATLEERDRRAGLAEAVKVAAIRDKDFFAWLEAEADALAAFADPQSERMIIRSAQLHLEHIAHGGDPFELGSARPLDFGHWAAHKLESLTGHRLRHGEAVAIGMALDSLYAAETGLLPPEQAEALIILLERLGFALWDDALRQREALLKGIDEFREHLGGRLTIAMLAGIGRAVDVHVMEREALERALDSLERR